MPAPDPTQNHVEGKPGIVERLLREGMKLSDERNLELSPSKLSRIIRAYVRKFGRVMTNEEMLEQYFLTHSDIVGETAIRNVMAKKKALNLNGVAAPNVQTEGHDRITNTHEGKRS